MGELQQDLSRFFQAWHALERGMGKAGGLVIDFDMADPALHAGSSPLDDRFDALRTLGGLRARVAAEPVVNRAFLGAKLAGAEAYLRALLGERTAFQRYLADTMGIAPQRVDPASLDEQREVLAERFEAVGVPFRPEGREAFRTVFGRDRLGEFADELRASATEWVAAVRRLLPDAPDVAYAIEVVSEDAYWANWIDGSVGAGVTLKVNTHPRIEYQRHSPLMLAAHEIAGHATHVACLRASAAAGRVDRAALNLSVHSCEAFQMEGLAQSVLHLVEPPRPVPDEVLLLEAYRDYSGAVVNNAQLDLEAGAPIDAVCDGAVAACPLSKPLTVRAGLRDRGRDPLFRSYIHVYAPSRALFRRAAALPAERKAAFLRAAYTRLWTPDQLAALVEGADPDVVGLS